MRTITRNGGDLHDPESVKAAIAKIKGKDSYKQLLVNSYDAFLKFVGSTWTKPQYKSTQKIPFIPLESEIDQLIAGFTKRISTFSQIAKETGARSGEIARLQWSDVDFEKKLIFINEPEKNSLPRVVKVSEKCINMINQMPRKGEKIFVSLKAIKHGFGIQRNKIAYKLNNPRLLQVHLHTFRHWHATMEYHKTKDIIHVQQRLGSVEEACKLIDAGFEYVGNIHGAEIFRKRK